MNKTEIMSSVKSYCDNQGWRYKDEGDVLYTGFCIEPTGKQYRTTIIVRDEGFLVYVYLPANISVERGEKLDSLVCRLNEGLVNGNFEREKGSSAVRYKIYESCVGRGAQIGAFLRAAIELAIRMVVACEENFLSL